MKKKLLGGGILGAILALLIALGIVKPPVNPSPTPTPEPSASATASPEATPSAFPTPSPAATPSPSPLPTQEPQDACQLLSTEGNGKCKENPTTVPLYMQAVESAQQIVNADRSLVDANGKVINEGAYTEAVCRVLRRNGYCATNGLMDECWVKRDTNAFSEHYDLVTRTQDTWLHYAARCTPAKF